MRHELAKSVIGTRRLVLRPLRASDAEAIHAYFGDDDVARWLIAPPSPYTLEHAQGYVTGAMRAADDPAGEIAFAITLKGGLIGTIGVRHRPAGDHQRHDGYNIGYWIGRAHWGEGLMTEAARGLIAHTFALTRAEEIYAGAFAGNEASLRVQEKIGFVRYSETMMFSKVHGRELPHVNTALARKSFEKLAA